MAGELLLEIGTEEIPSDYLNSSLVAIKKLAESYLKENRINTGDGLETCGTPRRLVVFAPSIADKQEDKIQEITGPPKKAAFDKNGKPTKAAIGFAKKHGVPLEELKIISTSKGEYLHLERRIPGKPTGEILSEVLPRLIADIPWPKSMRWGGLGFAFVRPIHWILALFNGKIIPFEIAGVKSGNTTRGHRFMAPEPIEVTGIQDYMDKMAKSFVIINQDQRAKIVSENAARAASEVSGKIKEDPELLSTVTNLVEFASPVCGGFDKGFLELPEPVLTTAMKKHQKYFPVYDQNWHLLPYFVAINNTVPRDESLVRKGHERVLKARLADAAFFFNEDRKKPLLQRLDDLKAVIYQADLGTSFAKVQRFARLAEYISEQVEPGKTSLVKLAARLSKCDLVTQMVTEFPELQGIMGEIYARLDGHPEEVCRAVREHYLPDKAEGELPSSVTGAVVGIADRMDTITGCFAVGLMPTGSADPFALRRHAIAIIRIIESFGWDISLQGLISKSISILADEIPLEESPLFEKVLDFFRERYKQMMLRSGYKSDPVEAVVSVAFDHIASLRSRVEQLEQFIARSEESELLLLAFKRVINILKNQEEHSKVDPALFKEPCEAKLWRTFLELKDDIHHLMVQGEFLSVLKLLSRLKDPVNEFFDGVEILTKESPSLRKNRLGLLQNLATLFLSFADFSKFSV